MSTSVLGAMAMALWFAGTSAAAQTRGWFPRQTAECGWVHGRYAVYNGSGVRRIWVIGTGHMLNLYDGDDSAPAELNVRLAGTDDALYGDFFVCAAEGYEPGHMQHVRVRRVRNLVRAPFQL